MKKLIISITLLFSTNIFGENLSLSGHWKNANGERFLLYHKANGDAKVFMTVESKRVVFKGKVALLSPKDSMTKASLYEIDVKSNGNVVVYNKKECEIKNISFSLLGNVYGNKEFYAITHVRGTTVCGKDENTWSKFSVKLWRKM